MNSTIFFLLVALICIVLSSSIQDAERQLRLDNETLNKEAGTDPLTGLPNRRDMISLIEDFQKQNPEHVFSVAIADIDFFKKVNDTYGHACGDYTLIQLTNLFKSESRERFTAARWGGEEFCFFLPDLNLDEAGQIMNDLSYAVEKMPLDFEDKHFNITITVGVEETDFHSSLDQLLDSADEKLYLGKNSGRNQKGVPKCPIPKRRKAKKKQSSARKLNLSVPAWSPSSSSSAPRSCPSLCSSKAGPPPARAA